MSKKTYSPVDDPLPYLDTFATVSMAFWSAGVVVILVRSSQLEWQRKSFIQNRPNEGEFPRASNLDTIHRGLL